MRYTRFDVWGHYKPHLFFSGGRWRSMEAIHNRMIATAVERSRYRLASQWVHDRNQEFHFRKVLQAGIGAHFQEAYKRALCNSQGPST